ncbi:cache domain-containing sensor histidine kinase [Metabacillus malikii]|uniref:Two-component system sensor histidine kinase YesM n=1 Tax=Metabacillus malikii TaxID=1504265 RepID=A0ABT9ZFY6_9BACI|nr:sensor histidine kinase [Metabacillus malikii]MDQ0231193.1 two-component system sensor histidine kinase YesM [Metabacillus malikii]
MNFKKLMLSSLRTKLLIMFVILTAIPLIFVGVVSYVKSINIISKNTHTFTQLQASQVSQDIDVIFQDTKRFTEISKLDSTIHFLTNDENTYEDAKNILNLFSFYREIYQSSDNIQSISIFNLDGKIISEDKGVHQLDTSPRENPEYTQLLKNPTDTLIQQTEVNNQPMISITDTVILEITGEVIGFINILIDATVIEEILGNATLGETGSFYVETAAGESLYLSGNQAGRHLISNWRTIREKDSGYMTNNSQSTFTVFDTVESTGWKVIGQAPLQELMKDANEIRSLIMISVGFSIIFTITLYFFISSKLIRPIRNLKENMKLASQGNLDVKVVNESSDEIADLANSFNVMIKKIKSLLLKSIDEQKQLTLAEFKALQSQINPHFLYNTLDNIIWMAEAKKSSEVIDMTKALSHFFRISLSNGEDVIKLAQEIDHVRNYLIIQKIRYRDILEVTFDFNDEIVDYSILKITLQPLVENAIYHGIKNKRGKGLVSIRGDFTEDGDICIEVIDNGIGIKEEQLTKIQHQLRTGTKGKKTSGGFGMFNVQKRIQLYYGSQYGLTIESSYQIGTYIRLTIPAMR